jgi:predicted glycoside hydrolase/deacetylase ChbG (UPF0249 family)
MLSRRGFFGMALAGLSVATVRPRPSHAGALSASPPLPPTEKYLIVNADDFGGSDGINRGVIEACERGIVTSASLLVTWPRAADACRLARRHPQLGVGLHAAFSRDGRWFIDLQDLRAVETELIRQFDMFTDLTGELPTHIDSHQHAHREFNVGGRFLELADRYHLPLRGFGGVVYVGGFYAQSVYGQSELARVGPDRLLAMLGRVPAGFTEIACHPGYEDAENESNYNRERVTELETLTASMVRDAVRDDGLRLVNYRDYLRLAARPTGDGTRTGDRSDARSAY